MAEREAFSKKLFHRADRVTLQTPGGEILEGRGVISALRRETAEAGVYRHALGNLTRPLARFTGYLPAHKGLPGSVITQGDRSYTVLDARKICLGEREICLRALLERRDESDG